MHRGEAKTQMRNLLESMGVEEFTELGGMLVDAAYKQSRQRKMWPKKFDDQNNSYEWVGYLVKTMGKGLESYPTNPAQFREQSIEAISLLLRAVLSIDRDPNNLIQTRKP
ncbi:MAG: hypothetical protein KKA61_02865 [Nanoarchaeota archaeon]|nr:hypothetical protein [Nanoarchaeota archaeon]